MNFFVLFIVSIEFLLGIVNYKEALGLTILNPNNNISKLKFNQLFGADEKGINYYLYDYQYSENKINKQGFISDFDFDSMNIATIKDTSKLVMFVGDSHTAGCCTDLYQNSFTQLINKENDITVLNFGIPGTDPLQYKLIIDKYLKLIQPDLLVIPLCLGNDFMHSDRKPTPFKPLYIQTNYSALDNRLPKSHPKYKHDTYFDSVEDAKNFYLANYTLFGVKTSRFEKYLIKQSNILSLFYYLPTRIILWKDEFFNRIYTYKTQKYITHKYINDINNACESNGINFLLVGVPSASDIYKNNSNANYIKQLKNIDIQIPTNFNLSDFVSIPNDHFVNSGHQKFADFLIPIIDSTLTYQTFSNSEVEN